MRLAAAVLALIAAAPLLPIPSAAGDDGIPLLGSPTKLHVDVAGHLRIRVPWASSIAWFGAPPEAGNVAVFLSGPTRVAWARTPDFQYPPGEGHRLEPGVYHVYAFADRPTTVTLLGGGAGEPAAFTMNPHPPADLLPQTLLGSGVAAPAGTPAVADRARFEAPARSAVVTFEHGQVAVLGAGAVVSKHHVQRGPGEADCQPGHASTLLGPVLVTHAWWTRHRWVVDPGTWEVGNDFAVHGSALALAHHAFTVRFQQAPGDSEDLWQNPGWPLLGVGPYLDGLVPDEAEAVVAPVACTAVPGLP